MAAPPSRKQQQEKARQDRLKAQQAAAARESRARRLQIVVGTVLAAAVLVGLGFVFLSGEDQAERATGGDVSTSASGLRGVTETNRLLRGVPQQGYTLGREDAPVTLYSYIDYQCPFCMRWDLQVMPGLIERFVRPGRLKVVTLPLDNIGEDSIRAAGVSQSMARKNRLYQYSHLFFYNQGPEGTGYADDAFFRRILDEIPGTAPSDLTPDISTDLRRMFASNQKQFSDAGASGTPAFEVGRSGSPDRQRFEARNEVFLNQLAPKVDELGR